MSQLTTSMSRLFAFGVLFVSLITIWTINRSIVSAKTLYRDYLEKGMSSMLISPLLTRTCWKKVFTLSLLLIFPMFLEATLCSTQAQTLGQFTFNNQQFGTTLTESDGGAFRSVNWLNVVNSNPGNPNALTGTNFNTGIGNIGYLGSTVYTISYDTPIVNDLASDLGIVTARFSNFDTFQLAVSTDGVNFTAFTNFGPEQAVSTGVGKSYFYNGNGPYAATLFVTPVDLSTFGLPLGASISAVRITSLPEGDLIRVAGFSSCENAGKDTDGDGLCNNWEEHGLTVNVNGRPVFVDLPAMGANKNHKDIFVEADYMAEREGHTHKPKATAIEIVTEAFKNAPVDNPDEHQGITLHVDCGPKCIMDPATGKTWGALSEARKLAHSTSLGFTSGDDYDWTAFDQIKQRNFSPARAPVFHYMIFAHNLGGLGGTSGISRGFTASDFIVSLGSRRAQVGTANQQAGTFMHELGHNLSLRHGGSDDMNHKPNYLSVMNYSFQEDGLILSSGLPGDFDYSRFALPNLDEDRLDENMGLRSGGPFSNLGTVYFCPNAMDSFVDNLNGPIDWNCSGANSDSNVTADINNDGTRGKLTGFDDWPNLVFNGGAIGQLGQDFTLPSLTPIEDEITLVMIPKLKVSVASPGITERPIGSSVDLVFTIANEGTQADTYLLTSSSDVSWASLGSLPSTIALGPGENTQITIHIAVPLSTAVGTEGAFTIIATSVTAPNMADSGEAFVTAIAPLCSAPTINTLTANPNILWPVNHKMVPVTLNASTSGGCGAVRCQIISITSNEPISRDGDWLITSDLRLSLRSERLGTGNGRLYTITVQCTDSSGNTSTKAVTVTVPHDQRK